MSVVPRTVGGGLLIGPDSFLPNHALTTWDFPDRPCSVKGTGFGTIARGFESIASLLRVPLVDDHFNRHPRAPYAASTLGIVGPSIEPSVTPVAVGRKIRGNAEPGRGISLCGGCAFNHLELLI